MWIYNNKPIYKIQDLPKELQDSYGFIYELTGSNGKKYIGMKQFFSHRSKVVSQKQVRLKGKSAFRRKKIKKGKKAGEMQYYEMVSKETDWKTYYGSSDALKKDLKNGVTFTKEILELVPRKGLMLYKETCAILCSNALERDDYYNRHVLNKFYSNNLEKE